MSHKMSSKSYYFETLTACTLDASQVSRKGLFLKDSGWVRIFQLPFCDLLFRMNIMFSFLDLIVEDVTQAVSFMIYTAGSFLKENRTVGCQYLHRNQWQI